jgi:hypothetical protein
MGTTRAKQFTSTKRTTRTLRASVPYRCARKSRTARRCHEGTGTYAAANILIAFTDALVGALLAPVFGWVGGVVVAFLLPLLDIGIAQSPMLNQQPTTMSRLLPG